MIAASLIGGGSPQMVQLVVDVTPNGVPWTITGSTGSWTWNVPGGAGIGDGGQLSLADNRAPGNAPVVYTFTAGGVSQSTAPIYVPFSGDFVLQTLTGSRALTLGLLKGSLETSLVSRQARFDISGRRRPAVRYDVTGDVEGELHLLVSVEQMPEFVDMIAPGSPLVYRLGTTVMDLDPVGVITYGNLRSDPYQTKGMRAWTMPYALVDDPYLDVRLGAFSWEDFDAAWAGKTWADFDTRMAGVTWDQFDTFDWSTI